MTVAAIIPAVAEPGVALERMFAGRPLLAHTIEQARLCPRVNATVVVTDDAVLARIARQAGADVVTAAGEGHRDGAAARAVGASDTDQLCVILDPSRPLRTPEMIAAAIDHLARRAGDSLISVHPTADALWLKDASGFGRLYDDEPRPSGPRPHLAENRSIILTRAGQLREWGQPLGGHVVLHEIARSYVLRLRSEEDWCAGEALHRRLWSGRAMTQLANIALLVFDFDGVMTDNRVVVFEDGREGVLCSRGDGMGLDLVRAAGVSIAVISKEGNPVVSARCRKLKIPCVQGVGEKLSVLRGLAEEQGVGFDAIAFMGNDVNDLTCMRAAALAIAPADAEPQILREAGLVTNARGGFGAVREIADMLIAARQG